MVVLSHTQTSCTSSQKRNTPTGSSQNAPIKKKIKTSGHARVTTRPGGTAHVNLVAAIPGHQATSSATIKITGGTATAHVSTSAQTTRKSSTKYVKNAPKQGPILLLPPWDSARL